jgi:predicted DNA-binding protein YlxM (UPF0122 family)
MSEYFRYKDSVENEILFRVDYEKFVEYQFTFGEMLLILLMLDGYSIVEMAEKGGVSRRQIHTRVKIIREKIKKFLFSLNDNN